LEFFALGIGACQMSKRMQEYAQVKDPNVNSILLKGRQNGGTKVEQFRGDNKK
jgi:hypothetical protein